jgi:hypothetical protein
LISRGQQAKVGNVNRLAGDVAQSLCQRWWKLRVDEKEQSLFRRDDRMVRLTGSKGQDRIDVSAFEISRLACRQQAQNIGNGNAQAANAWRAMHAIGVYCDPRQKV